MRESPRGQSIWQAPYRARTLTEMAHDLNNVNSAFDVYPRNLSRREPCLPVVPVIASFTAITAQSYPDVTALVGMFTCLESLWDFAFTS